MTVPLPPLPPAPQEEAYRPGGRSLVAVVGEEHRRIAGLARELADPTLAPDRRRELVEVLAATMSRHLSGEEQYLYPALRAALPDGPELADREIAADADLLRALKELTGAGEPRPADLVEDVARRWEAHVAAVGPALRRLDEVAGEAELIRLGNRLEIAEEAAPTRPHPGTPATPPWNRIVDPAVGVVDKVRDAVTGRPTYLSDLDER